MELIDIHSHMIPGIDDGASDEKIAIEMLRKSYEEGVRGIILTPHYHELRGYTARSEPELTHMRELAAQVGTDLRVYGGNELRYSSNTAEVLRSKEAATLAGSKYVLVEFADGSEYEEIRKGVNELTLYGYWPVLAHVERYHLARSRRSELEELLKAGAYLQVNAESFFSRKLQVRNFVRKLAREELLSFIGSDCHNMSSRPPNLRSCAELVCRRYGEKTARRIFQENPANVIENRRIEGARWRGTEGRKER